MATRFAHLALLAVLSCMPLTAVAALKGNAPVSYTASDGTRRIHDFSISGGMLVENYFDGSTWQWISHPAPSGDYAALFSPTAITYQEDGTRRIYVFAITGNGHKFVARWFNGSQWQWGVLPTASVLEHGKSSALTYLDESGNRRIHLFAVDDHTPARVVSTWWDGTTWQTTQFALPGIWRTSSHPVALTYVHGGVRRMYVYCMLNELGPNQPRLFTLVWNGGNWNWQDMGLENFRPDSALSYVGTGGMRRIQVFGANTANDSVAVYESNGLSWTLSDLGSPEIDPSGPSDVAAIAYGNVLSGRQVFVAATFNDHLHVKRHDGTGWGPYVALAGGNRQFSDDPAWVHYIEPRGGTDTLQLFVTSATTLMRHRWNGSAWQSSDQGAP